MERLIIVYILKDKKNKNVFELNRVSDIDYFFEYIQPCCLTYDIYKRYDVEVVPLD